MNKENNYTLIDGNFKADDASKILLEIINNKINYHNLQIFSIKEKFDGDTSHSELRINQLNEVGKSVKKLLSQAGNNGKLANVSCHIEIKIIQ